MSHCIIRAVWHTGGAVKAVRRKDLLGRLRFKSENQFPVAIEEVKVGERL